MLEPQSKQNRGLRPMHKLTVVATAVIAAIVAFWVLSSLVGIIAFLIKAVVVVAVIGGVLYLVVRHAASH
ncbi:MAG: hypothetical protein ABR925_01410 [Acidimicrobiales bacterium]